MGFLVPFYLAGLAALALPIVAHLVRRTPRGRQEFSSLMFLSPTPPRLTRRSRLDQLLLLALRLAALALLVLAFARPFVREAAALAPETLAARRVALVVDASASMRRADLWPQALAAAARELDELNPQDDVALYVFSDKLATVVDFERQRDAPPSGKPQVVRRQLQFLQPTWRGTDLGTALATVAGEIDAATDARQSSLEPQIVVVSDFQKGTQIEALQSFEWPRRVPIVLRPVATARTTNAFVHLLPAEDEGGDDPVHVRVRVVSASDSAGAQFYVRWAGDPAEKKTPDETAVYVPPGQSRVVRLPRAAAGSSADRIVLRGDDHDFDNAFYVVPLRLQKAAIVYAGSDGGDEGPGLLHFLRLAVANDPVREVEVRRAETVARQPVFGEPAPRLVIVSQTVDANWQKELQSFVERGGTVLFVPADDAAARSLPAFFDGVETAPATAAGENDYLLLGDLNFGHPLFAPFANPRYSDFTRIHFWKHRRLIPQSGAGTLVLARFDNGDPALLERRLGEGRFLALASGWHPADSQLALSSKFVPLIGALLDLACGNVALPASVPVGAPVPLPGTTAAGSSIVVHKPDGRQVPLAADAKEFVETDQPGIYRVTSGGTEHRFAMNLPAAESDTAPLEVEQLEQRGVRIGSALTRAERIERIRQQRDTELESRQRVWHWLIAAALGLLVLETWWAGRATPKIAEPSEVAS